jgi:hypothetical protein
MIVDALEQSVYAKQLATICRGGSGTGATATAALAATGRIKTGVIVAGGADYLEGDVLTVAGGTGGTFTVTSVDGDGAVTGITQLAQGTGYNNATGAATTTNSLAGAGATITTVVEKLAGTITVTAAGDDYVTAIARFSGGGTLMYADGSTTVVAGEVTAITGPADVYYTSIPTVTILAGGPADATDLITAVKAFDTSRQDVRVKAILEDSLITEVLTAEQAPIVRAAIAAL